MTQRDRERRDQLLIRRASVFFLICHAREHGNQREFTIRSLERDMLDVMLITQEQELRRRAHDRR